MARLPYHDTISPSMSRAGTPRAQRPRRYAARESGTVRWTQEHPRHRRQPVLAPCEGGIAVGRRRSGAAPAHQSEHGRDIGLPRDRHPGLAPDEVEDGLGRQGLAAGTRLGQRSLELAHQSMRLGGTAEDASEKPVDADVVLRRIRMGDDHRGTNAASSSTVSRRFSSIFTTRWDGASSRMVSTRTSWSRRPWRPNAIAHADGCKAGAADQQFRKPQVAEQFGKGRHQAHDARPLAGRLRTRPTASTSGNSGDEGEAGILRLRQGFVSDGAG